MLYKRQSKKSKFQNSAYSLTHLYRCVYIYRYVHIFFNLIFIFGCVWVFCCHARAFSSCGKWGPLFVAVHGLLIAVASLVVENGL